MDLEELKLKLKSLRLDVRHKVTETEVQRVNLDKEPMEPDLVALEENICTTGKRLLELITREKGLEEELRQKQEHLEGLNRQLEETRHRLPELRQANAPRQPHSDGEEAPGGNDRWAAMLAHREEIEGLRRQDELYELKLGNQTRRLAQLKD